MDSDSRPSGISAPVAVGIVLVTLKLLGYVDWSWWWVTLPFWLGMALAVVGCLLLIFGAVSLVLLEMAIVRLKRP
jgi:hypothetical protein